jgi:hypothetical protein
MTQGLSGTEVEKRAEKLFLDGGPTSTNSFSS